MRPSLPWVLPILIARIAAPRALELPLSALAASGVTALGVITLQVLSRKYCRALEHGVAAMVALLCAGHIALAYARPELTTEEGALRIVTSVATAAWAIFWWRRAR